MKQVAGILMPFLNQIYYIEVDFFAKKDELLVVDFGNGEYIYEVVVENHDFNEYVHDLKPNQTVRIATKAEIMQNLKPKYDFKWLKAKFQEAIDELNLPILPLGIMVSINKEYIKFIYYTEQRIEFAKLIRNLAKKLKCRVKIELYQAGSREYAATTGGYGVCGYELCCHSRHYSTPPITTNHIRYIGYRSSLKASLLGLCCKYKCCLLYEADQYLEYMEAIPDVGTKHKYLKIDYVLSDFNIFTKELIFLNGNDRLVIEYEGYKLLIKSGEISHESST